MPFQQALTITQPETRVRVSPVRQILSLWKSWVIILTPIICLPLPLIRNTEAGRCAYVILIMATYWMTEAIPIAVTALLPIALMPWLGIISSQQLCSNYLKDTNMLFVGGLLVAVAVEKWNLHKRIALGVLLFVGSKPKWLMFGFMVTTAFLSMWLSNTATTAMMIPIVQAVLTELNAHRKAQRLARANSNNCNRLPAGGVVGALTLQVQETNVDASTTTLDTIDGSSVINSKPVTVSTLTPLPNEEKVPTEKVPIENNNQNMNGSATLRNEDYEREDKAYADMCKGLTLCVAYAANIGGTATLTGTGPNLILKGQVDTLYDGKAGITFSSWFVYACPNMVLSLILAWGWLQLLFLGPKTLFPCLDRNADSHDRTANEVIKREYAKLGRWTWAEISTLCFFILLACLWFTREPEFMPGWADYFKDGYVTDASVAVTIGVLLFMFPAYKPNILCFRSSSETSEPGPVAALLDWPTVHTKLPWNVIIVLGGGFALADACKVSGLSDEIGAAFGSFATFKPWIMVCILVFVTATFTEVASNVATATIFLPILSKLVSGLSASMGEALRTFHDIPALWLMIIVVLITTAFTNVASNVAAATIFLPVVAEVAEAMMVNPLYLMLPVTIATSLAFMLPVATPPNAMVFAYGHMKIVDMAKAGALMNVLCILCLLVATNTWGYAYFKLGRYPDWASRVDANITATTVSSIINATLS